MRYINRMCDRRRRRLVSSQTTVGSTVHLLKLKQRLHFTLLLPIAKNLPSKSTASADARSVHEIVQI